MSRVYLGIHFRYDSIEGNRLGTRIGQYGWNQHLAPVGARQKFSWSSVRERSL